MNDVEHDLRELFDQRAAGVDVPGLAPKEVLKRGRRRQVGTVVTGVVACLVALGIAAAALGQARRPAVVPMGNGLPARSTSIGGVPVTAPAGWTLVDDYPFASVYAAGKQTCTFSGTGTPVEGNGSPVEGTSSAPANTGEGGGGSSQSCTETTTTYPAGIPVLQLANFEIPLDESVCGRGGYLGQASLPTDGVAVYVADTQADPNITALQTSCPGSADAPGGTLTTFLATGHSTIYVAITVVGPNASNADIAVARHYVSDLSTIEITPTTPTADQGPGYVVATGTDAGTPWRLEAGLGVANANGEHGVAAAVMVTTRPFGEVASTVQHSSGPNARDDYSYLGTQRVVQFGTAGPDVTGITATTSSGLSSQATLVPWPDWFSANERLLGQANGWLWFALTSGRGSLDVHVPSESSQQETPPSTVPGGLRTFTDGNGFLNVFGTAFGHEWSFQQDQGTEFLFSLDGKQQDGYVLTPGGSTQIDIPGGTLLLAFEPPRVKQLYVTSDAEGTHVVANGAWARSADYADAQGHIWVVPMEGSGRGYEWTGDRLPIAIGWPTTSPPAAGDLIAAGSTPSVSWAETWSDLGCPTFQVVASMGDGDLGSSPCPVPWDPQEYANRPSYIGGVYGRSHATVWMLGPSGMLADVNSPDDPTVGGNCGGSIANEGQWAQTGECIFVIPVGQTYVIHPTLQDGTPLDQTITITAQPGRIKTSQTGGSPSPTP